MFKAVTVSNSGFVLYLRTCHVMSSRARADRGPASPQVRVRYDEHYMFEISNTKKILDLASRNDSSGEKKRLIFAMPGLSKDWLL